MVTCKKCLIEKETSEFNKDRTSKSGISIHCRSCSSERSRIWYRNNPDKVKSICKRSRLKNKERISIYQKNIYKLKDKEKLKEQRKKYKELNPEYGINKQRERTDFFWSLKKDKPCVDCGFIFPPVCMDFDHIDPKTKFKSPAQLTGNKKKLLEEITKCELVCSNCHRIRTLNRYRINEKDINNR